jgi:hypothetical protein
MENIIRILNQSKERGDAITVRVERERRPSSFIHGLADALVSIQVEQFKRNLTKKIEEEKMQNLAEVKGCPQKELKSGELTQAVNYLESTVGTLQKNINLLEGRLKGITKEPCLDEVDNRKAVEPCFVTPFAERVRLIGEEIGRLSKRLVVLEESVEL